MRYFLHFLLFIAIITISMTPFSEEAVYQGSTISYMVEKGTGEVFITIGLEDPLRFSEIKIVRSEDPVKYFRQVKLIRTKEIAAIQGSGVFIDKFPLPGSIDCYYKLIAIEKSGARINYPSVKLVKN